jgi:hypothetical protein
MRYTINIIIICSIVVLVACKKDKNESVKDTIRFTYNGQQYDGGSSSLISSRLIFPEFIFANFAGLVIKRPDIFGGEIRIYEDAPGSIECAYLEPIGSTITGFCNSLLMNNGVIDSVRVYWIESGSVSFGYSDCKALTNVTVQGQKDCAINGTFNVTLTNKNNDKIILSNGTLSGRIKRYN